MRVVVYGAGGVGGTIGARLHMSGTEVVLIARGAHFDALKNDGMRFVAADGEHRLEIPVASHPGDVDWQETDLVLLTVKSQHTVDALDALAASASRAVPVVCGQNGVANERMALRRFERVYGMLINLPAIHLEPGLVVTHASGVGGILDTGCYPGGTDDVVDELMARLTDAGFSARPDERIMRKKYAKLLGNLGNIVQAATVGPEGRGSQGEEQAEASRQIFRRLRMEALACYEAAGIDCASAEDVRARREDTYRMVDVPGFPRAGGSSWQSISRGTGNVETDFLNGEITLLGGLHDVPTPANRICQTIASRMLRERLPVGWLEPSELLDMMREKQE
jgi:2-dehydropantoate 2-reductase